MKCSEGGCKENAAYRVKGPDGTVAFLCAKHVTEWSPKSVMTVKRYLRNMRCYVALGVLLALTLPFVAYLAYASTNKIPTYPGTYLCVKPVSLNEVPPPATYIVLNYSYRSPLNDYDLVYVMDHYDEIADTMKRLYNEGKLGEYEYQCYVKYGLDGRLIEEVKAMMSNETRYILWQPENRWFEITTGFMVDFNMPISPIESSFLVGLAIGWIALVVYTFKGGKLK